MRRPRGVRPLIVAAALLAGAGIGRVATASTAVPAASLGYGSAASVSPYEASGVAYTLDPASPQEIDQVAFTLSPPTARVVEVQLAGGGAWYPCTNAFGSVTCATTSPQATATGSTELTVVATQ